MGQASDGRCLRFKEGAACGAVVVVHDDSKSSGLIAVCMLLDLPLTPVSVKERLL